jgi:hypothetical protein
MSRERFESILRSYRIVPRQHKEAFVIEALSALARDEPHIKRPSEPLASSVPSREMASPDLSIEQVEVFRSTISKIDEMLEMDIENDKRQRLLSKREHLTRRIESVVIPDRQEESTESLDEDPTYLSLT